MISLSFLWCLVIVTCILPLKNAEYFGGKHLFFFFSSAFVANLGNHIERYGERIVESVRFKCLYCIINSICGIYRRLHDISWMVQVLLSVQHNDFLFSYSPLAFDHLKITVKIQMLPIFKICSEWKFCILATRKGQLFFGKSHPICQDEFIIIIVARICEFILYLFFDSFYCRRYPNSLILKLVKWV